jgi:hypothetical protein
MLALTDSALAPLYHLRHGPRPDRRRALELLAFCRDGCTEAILRAHEFSTAQMVDSCALGSRLRTPSAWLLAAADARSRSRGQLILKHAATSRPSHEW